MKQVIRFLETLGQNAVPACDYVATIESLDLADAHRTALLAKDHAALNILLRGRPIMFCMVAAPDEDVPEHDIPDQEEPGEPAQPDLVQA